MGSERALGLRLASSINQSSRETGVNRIGSPLFLQVLLPGRRDTHRRKHGCSSVQGSLSVAYPATRSRTLNSSYHLLPSRATHHNCNMPVSVTTLSKLTGTSSLVS